jgi:deoxyadenosine/deoxycytidine kinase
MTIPSARGHDLIVFDGHDGAGKTMVARRVAEELGGTLVRPFEDDFGLLARRLQQAGDYGGLNRFALESVAKVLKANSNGRPLVFDRHWMSIFTLVPRRYYASWQPLPFTFLCWADLPTTVARIAERAEPPVDTDVHVHYCERYQELAEEYSVPLLDTTGTVAEHWVRQLVSR